MSIFPTQYSLLSAVALKDKLELQYGLRNMTCRLMIHNVGDTYSLENTTTRYIFKVYRSTHRSVDEIKGEVQLLTLLHQGGAKVARPVEDIKGDFIQHMNAAEGVRHGVLFTFAEGTVKSIMTDEQLGILGREMALVHQVSLSVELSYPRKQYTIASTITEPLQRIKPAFTKLPAEYGYLTETAARIINTIDGIDLSSFSHGYCHYDFLPKNFHFTENGEITFFDFDFAGKGLLVNDLASLYAHFFLLVSQNIITRDEADRAFAVFVAGYRTIRPISNAELSTIPYFGFAWWIFYFGFHYDNFEDWSNFFFTPRFITERVALIKRWVDGYC